MRGHLHVGLSGWDQTKMHAYVYLGEYTWAFVFQPSLHSKDIKSANSVQKIKQHI